MKKISILGECLTIRFNMAVEIAYEEISGKPFLLKDLDSQKNLMALYMAAIITCNPDTEITFEKLTQEASSHEITLLAEAVISAMTEWLKVPDVIEKDAEPTDEDEKPKN